MSLPVTYLALSLKQPWAALLIGGLKSIEIRRWQTAHRGPLLIHAARIPDPRPEGWAALPPHLGELARLQGGLLGIASLTACKHYPDHPSFLADQTLHLNAPDWFDPRGLFGFCFADARPLPFRPLPGQVRLFHVDVDPEPLPQALSPGVRQRLDRLFRSLGLKHE